MSFFAQIQSILNMNNDAAPGVTENPRRKPEYPFERPQARSDAAPVRRRIGISGGIPGDRLPNLENQPGAGPALARDDLVRLTQQTRYALLARVQAASAQNAALLRQLEDRIAQLCAKMDELDVLAKQAVADGHDPTARLALQQRSLALIELKSLQAGPLEIQLDEQRIAMIAQLLEAHIQAARNMWQEVQAASVEGPAPVKDESLSRASSELAGLETAVERIEQKTGRMQAHVFALEHLTDPAGAVLPLDANGDPLAGQLVLLTIRDDVENQLRELKGPAPATVKQ